VSLQVVCRLNLAAGYKDAVKERGKEEEKKKKGRGGGRKKKKQISA